MDTLMNLLPMTGWALVGAFAVVIVLALACFFFVRGMKMLHKAEEIAPHMMALEAVKAAIAKTEGELDNLRSKLENAKDTIARADTAKQYIQDHEPRIESMRREEELLKTNLDVAKERLQKATEAYTDLEGKNNELYKKLTEAQQALEFKEVRLREVQAETTRLQSDKKQLEAAIAALSKNRQEIELAIASLTAKQAELERLDREIDRLRAEIAELNLQHSTLTQQNDNLKITQSKLNASIQELIAKESEAKIAYEKAQKELDDLLAKIKELKKEHDKWQAQGDKAREEAIKQEEKARAAENDGKRYTELADKRKKDLIKVNDALANARGTLDALNRKISMQTTLSATVKDAWQDLDRPAVEPVDRLPERQTPDEASWLAKLGKRLENCGFAFPERTLNAFHTSLKCGEESPLVVLAGISGTGKSLLPELYAAAAGMNFLSVPVQPRWDGPQDVLGFYNYMEGRYKATELARFLWQADRWNNPDYDNAFPVNALNIVLLDEMNLARVEYYFADFLSKLETRREVNPEDEMSRRNAELTLECGAGLKPRHLFPDFNTFFVGTMNEDETTQMLSDKVIDRSNLLRFGRPAQLAGKTDKQGFLDAVQKEPRISCENWEKWNAKDKEISLNYQEQLEELNKRFATIGRPFGHRVRRSIDAYMYAYPILGLDAEKIAFADQIEMKVLPKLNGLELETPGFDKVKTAIIDTITSLKDKELLTAFQEAANPNHTFFRWRGVMRSN